MLHGIKCYLQIISEIVNFHSASVIVRYKVGFHMILIWNNVEYFKYLRSLNIQLISVVTEYVWNHCDC
jgi:hypothetical protein